MAKDVRSQIATSHLRVPPSLTEHIIWRKLSPVLDFGRSLPDWGKKSTGLKNRWEKW